MIKTTLFNTVKDAVWYGASTMLARVSVVVLLPLYARWFVPAELGVVQGLIVMTNFCYVIMALQLISVTMRFYYEYEREGQLNELLGTLMAVLCLSIVSFGSFFIFKAFWISTYLFKSPAYRLTVVLALVGTAFWVVNDYLLALMRLRRRVVHYFLLSFFQFVGVVILNVIFIRYIVKGIDGVFWAMLFTNVILFVLLAFFGHIPAKLKWSTAIAKRAAKYTTPALIIPVMEWFRNYFYQLYSLKYFGEAQLGIISVAIRFVQIYILFDTAIALAWQPTSMSVIEHSRGKELYRYYYRYLMCVYLVLFVVLSLFSKEIILLAATEKYVSAFRCVPLLFLMPLGKALYSHYSMGITISEKTIYRTIANVCGAAVAIILIVFLGYIGGQYGVLIGSGIGSLAIALIALPFSNKYFRIGYSMRPLVITLLCCTVVSIYNAWIANLEVSGLEIAGKVMAVVALIALLYRYWLYGNEKEYIHNFMRSVGLRLRLARPMENYHG